MAPPYFRGLRITIVQPFRKAIREKWRGADVRKWVTNAGGFVSTRLEDDTTHVVCSEDIWTAKGELIKAALQANAEGRNIKIVSEDWLVDSLIESKKLREKQFMWTTMTSSSKRGSCKGGNTGDDGIEDLSKLGAKEVFEEYTGGFVNRRDNERFERQREEHEAARKKVEDEARRTKERERAEETKHRREDAALVRRGLKKPRNEVFSDNHHIFRDDTGFAYEIILFKEDTARNNVSRQVLTLQIFESNSEPRTYAMNQHFAATSVQPNNRILAAVGVNLHTAFRTFKRSYDELAGHKWDDRIATYVQRTVYDGQLHGKEDGPDVPMDENVPFDKRPFLYDPPHHGPKGALPDSAQAALEVLEAMRSNTPIQERVQSHQSGHQTGSNKYDDSSDFTGTRQGNPDDFDSNNAERDHTNKVDSSPSPSLTLAGMGYPEDMHAWVDGAATEDHGSAHLASEIGGHTQLAIDFQKELIEFAKSGRKQGSDSRNGSNGRVHKRRKVRTGGSR